MKSSNITIMFNGNTEAAFNFYKSVFGGEFTTFQRMKDIPGDHQMPPESLEKILYVQLPIGNSSIMGMDVPAHMPPTNAGNNFMVTLDTSSEEENTRLFNELSEGGIVMMPLGHQFWGAFFGMVTDQFGIQWMLSYVKEQ
jgi:PhnB protein